MDLPFLQSLGELIGLALVMMLAGAAVAAVTQAVSLVARGRQRYLRAAVEQLLARFPMTRADAAAAAEMALRHPLVAPHSRRASSVRREELVRVLLELAAEPSAKPLQEAFGFHRGAADAARLLRALDGRALRLERARPSEPLHLRQTRAILGAAGPNRAIARIHAEFAGAMRRATARYRLETRVVAAAVALGVVFAMRLDSLELLGRAARLQHAPSQWVGLALSWMLLSLGAPFWYDRLKDLLHLRPGR
jgi:hypothetical protein